MNLSIQMCESWNCLDFYVIGVKKFKYIEPGIQCNEGQFKMTANLGEEAWKIQYLNIRKCKCQNE